MKLKISVEPTSHHTCILKENAYLIQTIMVKPTCMYTNNACTIVAFNCVL